jgi:YegS/Rv2252/BmrU family lipid kinase
LIYNPAAGKVRRNPESFLQRTTTALARASIQPRLTATRGPGDAAVLAREAAEAGADLVLVLGGDGTINEAANGLAHSGVPMGVLPGGTANVLAVELGLSTRLETAAERLGRLRPRSVALGRMSALGEEARYFLMICGAGLDARVCREVSSGLKRKTGKFAYWVAGMSQITHRVDQLQACVNGETYRCGFALAGRVRNYGGDLEITAGATLASDDFEVVLFEGSNPLRYLWYLVGVTLTRVQEMRGVRVMRAQRVQIMSDAHIQIDGEYAGRKRAVIEIVPDAITLLVPPEIIP